jgi:hypothetical protein
MIANVRMRIDVPDEQAKAALERQEPGMARRWDNGVRADQEQIDEALDDWVKDELPSLLSEYNVESYEVEFLR